MADRSYRMKRHGFRSGMVPSLIFNIILVILELGVGIQSLLFNGRGLSAFIYFTNLSNLVCFISAVIYILFVIREYRTGRKIPLAAVVLRYMATVMLGVTFFVVLGVLSGTVENGLVFYMFSGEFLFVHFLCPVISFISTCFYEQDRKLPFGYCFMGLIPTAAYAAVTIPLNALNKLYGPYPFLHVHEQPLWMSVLWCVVILAGTFVISLVFWFIKKKRTYGVNI